MNAERPRGEAPVTKEETLVSLLKKSQRRRGVPIRKTFLQQGSRTEPQPGPIATLVRHRDERALDLFLLHRTLATKAPYDTRLEAGVWARMISAEGPSGRTAVSRAWGRLSDLRLVERRRGGRLAVVRSLREDGTGAPYSAPGLSPNDTYLQLPLWYWLAGYDSRLALPGKAALLIFLSLRDGWCSLPSERVPDWYGISADTAERGIDELVALKVLWRRPAFRRTPLVSSGFTKINEYQINPAFQKRRKLIATTAGLEQLKTG